MDLDFTWEQQEFRRQVARFAEERIAPIADQMDERGLPSRELIREMGELGFLGVKFPEEYGGSGVTEPHTYHCILVEELSKASAGFASTIAMGTSVPPSSIFHFGSEDLKQRYLVPTLRGEMVGAFGLTEPDAGSDAAAIRTRAVRDGDVYLLNGTKIFTTNGTIADYVTVAAKTDPDRGMAGISLFLVDTRTKGFRVGKKLSKFTTHSSDTAEIVLEDLAIPKENLLGEENSGLLSLMNLLEEDRIMTAAISLGIAKAAYEAALQYSRERKQFGKEISKFQAVRFRLAEMLALLEGAELYTYYAARKADRGARVAREAAIAKIIVCEGANKVCSMAASIFGGYGLMTEYPVERYLRDSYFPLVGGGTPDIMRVVVARELGI
ncbi:MAG: acyl-CoA dehydrogenase family protein [Deltaproteobacteria bacterium]|nr:acyl-CoA dehydrogenase family protein [Deltaproteobacteria bacterium]